ncbi:monooxygenase [Prauserella coralliicola]|nr:monooxygenase [Prauserella coralliicola]
MTAAREVLISGAGIAGPALAYWLHEHGIRGTIVERAPAPRSGGYAVDVRGAAIDVAHRMGILENLRATTSEIARGGFVDSRGRIISGFDTSTVAPGERSLEVLRGDLVRFLHESADTDTEYLYEDTITALTQHDGGVDVTFERGEPRTFDLVVGADGLHSNVRRLAFGPEAPYRRFLGSYVSIFTVPNSLELDREARLYNTPGRLAAMYHTPRADGAKALLLHRVNDETEIDRRDPVLQQEHLRSTFDGMGWETDTILAEMERATDFYFDSVTQIKIDRWSQGRVTLVGDAGYCPSPMSGQGSSLAIVGAHVLAEELARHDSHETALAAYEARMRPFVAANHAIADPGLSFIAPRSRWGIATRNLLIKAAPLLSTLSRFSSKVSNAAEAIDLSTGTRRGV